MTSDQARRIAELLGNAKGELLSALKVAEQSGNADIARKIEKLCAASEVLQNKVSAKVDR